MAAQIAQKSILQFDPGYSITFGLEKSFDYRGSVELLRDNWYIPWFLATLFYLPILYFGQMIMRNREPFRLKATMMSWNSGLAIFSIIGFIRVFPEWAHSLNKFGLYHSICNSSFKNVEPARFWIYLFVISKVPELGDTFFLVLRKQKLIFLHVYHHASVLIFAWFVYSNSLASARWFCTMNFGVHSIMYTYYVLKAVPNIIRIPKFVSMMITALQTIQMVVGAYVVASSYYAKLTGKPCETTATMSICGLVIYISYLLLFSHFFYRAYLMPRPPKEAIKDSVNDKKKV